VAEGAAARLLTARSAAPVPPGSDPSQVFKPLKASGTAGTHTAIMLSNYLDYTRLRRYFRENDIEFEGICEYTPPPKVSRARTLFYNGQAPLLLYTERFHYYWRCVPTRARRLLRLRLTGLGAPLLTASPTLHRYKIRGIRNLIFYSLPENAGYYSEMLNMLEGNDISCAALFTPYDLLRLERIVGTDRAKRMVASDKPLFMFV